MSEIEEPDRLLEFAHPRETLQLLGHEAQTTTLSAALASNRFPHAWIFSGPAGIGKATCAYGLARLLLKHPPGADLIAPMPDTALDFSADSIVFQQVAAQSHPGLKVIKRPYDHRAKRLKTEITVDEIRKLHGLFNTTTTDGGWRIALIDSADEMNANAANALLKMLEEPPGNSVIILISHQSGRLLPTIRSRCRMLSFNSLGQDDILKIMATQLDHEDELDAEERDKIARLANGSARNALQLACGAGLKAHESLISLLESLPQLNGAKAHEIAERLSRRDAADEFVFFSSPAV